MLPDFFDLIIWGNEHESIDELVEEPALGSKLVRVDIVDLRNNTFFAQLVLNEKGGERTTTVDARPSDAVALALRARCPLRVAESVLEAVRTDESGPDKIEGEDEDPPEDPA
jgi:bifunctional DNase/RNase